MIIIKSQSSAVLLRKRTLMSHQMQLELLFRKLPDFHGIGKSVLKNVITSAIINTLSNNKSFHFAIYLFS